MSGSSPVKSTRRPQAEGNGPSVSSPGKEDPPAAAAAAAAKSVNPMVGRKILKPLGDKICEGFVVEHKPAGGGREEMWVLRWELESEQDEEVARPVLDKRLNLKAVQEREFPSADSEETRGKVGTKKDRAAKAPASPAKPGAPAKASTPTKGSTSKAAAGAKAGAKAAASVKPAKAAKAKTPKRRASAGKAGASPLKKVKVAKGGKDAGADKLLATKKDVGKLVAKEFEQGIFTGKVVKVRMGTAPLWQIRYEDEDVEELNKAEALGCMALYKILFTKFAAAKGTPVALEEEEEPAEGGEGEKGKEKEKGKGKMKRAQIRGGDPEAQIAVLGLRVRKCFGKANEEYDGTVSELYPKEKDGDDELGDLWLVKYDDGDSEHMNLGEVQAAATLYDERHALQKKEITFIGGSALGSTKKTAGGTKITLYAEAPAESRLFSTIAGYSWSLKRDALLEMATRVVTETI